METITTVSSNFDSRSWGDLHWLAMAGRLTIEVERVAGTNCSCVSAVVRESVTGWIPGQQLLCRLGGSLRALFTENAEDTNGNLAAGDSLVLVSGARSEKGISDQSHQAAR